MPNDTRLDPSPNPSNYLTPEEAKDIYTTLGRIPIEMPPGAYAQRFVKRAMKACVLGREVGFHRAGFISSANLNTLKEVTEILSRKPIRTLEWKLGLTRLDTVYEALLWIYLYMSHLEHGLPAKLVYRGQRRCSWSLSSTRSRGLSADAATFKRALRERIKAKHPWAFPDQLEAAAQHYGYPTDLIDFSLDPDIAVFFATRGAEPDDTGAVHVLDATCERALAIVFLPAIFRRIHRQAGVFIEMPELKSADQKVLFSQATADGFKVYDAAGCEFDPLEDGGPIERVADEVAAGQLRGSSFNVSGLEDYDLIDAFVQEACCTFVHNQVITHPEPIGRLVVANYPWWQANIQPYIEYLRAAEDGFGLQRAMRIREYIEILKEAYPQGVPRFPDIEWFWDIWNRTGG